MSILNTDLCGALEGFSSRVGGAVVDVEFGLRCELLLTFQAFISTWRWGGEALTIAIIIGIR